MKLKSTVFTVFLALFASATYAQCSANAQFQVTDSTVQFYDSSYAANGYRVEWSFGDGNSSTALNPSHTYANNATYTPCLVIEDTVNNCIDTACWTISIGGSGTGGTSCSASFNYTADSSNPSTIHFTNTSNNASSSSWQFGGSSSSTATNPSHTFNATGYQTVCLTTYDSSGNLCDSVCQTVYVQGNTTSCQANGYFNIVDSTVYFFDSSYSANGYNLEWSFGDSSTSTASNPTHTYATNQYYTVCLYIEDTVSSCNDTMCWSIYIQGSSTSNCDASFTYTVDSMNMSASSYPVFFDHNSDTTLGFLWTFGDSSTSNAPYPTHTYSAAGTYTVCLTVITGYDSLSLPIVCDTFCTTVTVGGSPVACQASYYLGVDTNNLYNIYIINNSTGTTSATNYSWSFGDGSTSTAQYPTHQYSTFGLYNLCLTISDSTAGCSSTYCDSIGLDSNGNLLKRDGFDITVVDENDLLSTADLDLINELNVYPNPSNGSYTIKLNLRASEEVSIRAINSLGQEVLAQELNGLSGTNEYSIDMTAQPNGIYFLSLRAGTQSKNVKVYINR
jgi:PKD repeat protein